MPLKYKRVLMVDDDADDQLLFTSALQQIDATMVCEIASHGLEALEKLKTFDADVIFLDLNMPLMNGIECLTALKKNKKLLHIPVIIFTTTNDQVAIDQTKKLGATAFFRKPIEFEKLREKLLDIFLNRTGRNESALNEVFFII